MELKLYTEMHTRDILSVEKSMFHSKLTKIKNENQNMARQITKDKYHNRREADVKEKKIAIEKIKEEIEALGEEVLKE